MPHLALIEKKRITVYTLYCRSPAHLGDENILRLDISMKAVVLVAEVHSLKNIHISGCAFFSSPVMRLVNNNYILMFNLVNVKK